jgi:manganese/zinc/iron transport system permease protein
MNLNDGWIILTTSLIAICCAIPGCFLVLRRMAMFGDAISHAVLPGLVLAYLIGGSRSGSLLLIGAAASGLLVTFLIELIQKRMKIQSDAAIGITYTFLFAVGVILVSLFTAQTDLDQECVLYGDITLVPFDLISVVGFDDMPRQVWIASVLLLTLLLMLVFGYRGLYLTTFDPGYATALGISVAFWHYLLMGMVSLATVVSFESVGAIMVIALLVGPAATAALFARSLPAMIILACIIGILAGFCGYLLAGWLNAAIAGAIATVIGVFFFLGLLVKSVLKR